MRVHDDLHEPSQELTLIPRLFHQLFLRYAALQRAAAFLVSLSSVAVSMASYWVFDREIPVRDYPSWTMSRVATILFDRISTSRALYLSSLDF